MVKKITIERECQHKIIMKQGLVVLLTASAFSNELNEISEHNKYVSTNISLVNDHHGAVLSKISGCGSTFDEAYKLCIEKFNKAVKQFKEENEILLCCKNVPIIEYQDLQDYYLTRLIKFSWINELNSPCLFTAYVRSKNDHYIFTYDGADKIFDAKSDEEIIKLIFDNCSFDIQPKQLNIKRKDMLFYPTTKEFNR